jgi:flagellar basal-body rod protein FlgC
MQIFSSLNISASGMTAQRLRLDLIANNLANVNTTRTEGGGPYQRQIPLFAAKKEASSLSNFRNNYFNPIGSGVRVVGIVKDPTPAKVVYDPQHPDAGPDGYVAMPNVNVVMEMTDLISASRAYEANVTAFNAGKTMAIQALEIGR